MKEAGASWADVIAVIGARSLPLVPMSAHCRQPNRTTAFGDFAVLPLLAGLRPLRTSIIDCCAQWRRSWSVWKASLDIRQSRAVDRPYNVQHALPCWRSWRRLMEDEIRRKILTLLGPTPNHDGCDAA